MICIDNTSTQHPQFGECRHLISDLPGLDGEVELLEFGLKIGLYQPWLQNQGMLTVHFDAMNSKIGRAIALGAKEIDGPELRSIFLHKKQWEQACRRSSLSKE